jgi:hypothetical protein
MKDFPCVPSDMPADFEGTIKAWIKKKRDDKIQEQINELRDVRQKEKQKESIKLGVKCFLTGVFEAAVVFSKQRWTNYIDPTHRKDLLSRLTMGIAGIGIILKEGSILLDTPVCYLVAELCSFFA